MKILITGGAGFIGSNFVRYLLKNHPDYELVILDKLTYAGRIENLRDVINNVTFIKGDICKKNNINGVVKGCDAVLNFAAETHVDRSIIESGIFVKTDVIGTHTLLEAVRKFEVEKFIQISTDEVYGSREKGSFRESDILDPSSPYSASKGGADLLVNAYYKTYSLPVVITRSSNNYGPYQYPEKVIPLFITKLIEGKKVLLYGDGLNVRDWLWVGDNCRGIDIIFENGKIGEIYNIGGNYEITNLELTHKILKLMNKGAEFIQHIADRLGHDRRYSLDCEKIKALGWKPEMDFDEGLKKTVEWYKENIDWWKPLKTKK